jgi:hypothetical protein
MVAQARTECSGPCITVPEPRKVLPSIATYRIRKAALTAATQAWKHAWSAWGLRQSKTHSNVSCEGMPCGSFSKR